jgi:hypothetical protein
MRSQQIIDAVKNVVTANFVNIKWIIYNVDGGWEGWLQVATILALKDVSTFSEIIREVYYPKSQKRCDILLKPSYGVPIYFELKVQNAPNDDILDRFFKDINKIEDFGGKYKKNIYVALACMEIFDEGRLNNLIPVMPDGWAFKRYDYNGANWLDVTATNPPPVLGQITIAVVYIIESE